ncbi:hypothetical protein [Microcoleus sp. F4-D5]|uniref:hypothetical protein n=1 Tax=Microcoleus sp. F4-D5 TaxID=2818760 RepID=UPI002FD2CE09
MAGNWETHRIPLKISQETKLSQKARSLILPNGKAFDNQASRMQAPGFIPGEIKNLYPIKEPRIYLAQVSRF